MAKNNTLLIVGVAVGGYLLLTRQGISPVAAVQSLLPSGTVPIPQTGTTSNGFTSPVPATVQQPAPVQPITTYPYLLPNSPPLPSGFNQIYYLTYVRPAMVAANPNVNNPGYKLSDVEANVYMQNYKDVAQWATNTGPQGGARHQSPVAAAQYHWHTYGVPDQRTFLVLPWNDPAAWVPAPVNPKSSGGGVFGTILKAATLVGGVVAEVATAGAASSIIIPATTAAIAAEGQIMSGPRADQLNDVEVNLIITSAAIIKKILPFYLEVAPALVTSIENRLDSLISDYAV